MKKIKNKRCGVYKIQSKINPQLFYIGASASLDERWEEHAYTLSINRHPNKKIQQHYNEYGLSDLEFSIVMYCEKKELRFLEQWFFNWMMPTFNIHLLPCRDYATKQIYTEHMKRVNDSRTVPRKTINFLRIDKYQ